MEFSLPSGFRFAGVACGLKSKANQKDLSVILSDRPAVAAGVYTQNQVVAAPVTVCRERTPSANIRAVVVNSGNANACTGTQGDLDSRRMCQRTADGCGQDVSDSQVLVMSTGIIGVKLPMDKVEAGIDAATNQLADGESAFINAADGILTTDNARKIASRQFTVESETYRIAGMAKGAGMIGPNMATFLSCLVTDAALEPTQAQRILQATADRSFNNISVEGHTSTNDTMLLLANGAAGNSPLCGAAEEAFIDQLTDLCIELAKLIPADGEGATHLIEIVVRGAATDQEARQVAECVASSNLVKTAIYGNDPNWGRIVSAAGYSDAVLDLSHTSLRLNETLLFSRGEPIDFNAAQVSESIRENSTTLIELWVGKGSGECTHWTSDLTVEYVQFNSEYTT